MKKMVALLALAAACTSIFVAAPKLSYRIVAHNGGRVDWGESNRVAFDHRNWDGYFDVYTMSPTGSRIQGLTDGKAITQRHNGNPTWHQSGIVVFQSEAAQHYQDNDLWYGNPGLGLYSNLYATDGISFWQLTDEPIKQTRLDGLTAYAVLNPHFSGDTLYWSERYADGGHFGWGKWRIWSATFSTEPPRLSSARVAYTATLGNYVTLTDVAPDGSLLLAGNLDGQHEYEMDLYLYSQATGVLRNLTHDSAWSEGSAIAPDGQSIVYMSNTSPIDSSKAAWWEQRVTREYFTMRLDGSDKRQVTHFNEIGYPEYSSRTLMVNDCSWSPDGNRLASAVALDVSNGPVANYILKIYVLSF